MTKDAVGRFFGHWCLVIPPASVLDTDRRSDQAAYMLFRYFTAWEISKTGSSLSRRSIVR